MTREEMIGLIDEAIDAHLATLPPEERKLLQHVTGETILPRVQAAIAARRVFIPPSRNGSGAKEGK
jgi:hypothetical protein